MNLHGRLVGTQAVAAIAIQILWATSNKGNTAMTMIHKVAHCLKNTSSVIGSQGKAVLTGTDK
jgi:hypothetical protein